MPFYLRGKRGWVETEVEPTDRIAQGDMWMSEPIPRCYRIALPMTEIWPDYVGSPRDGLHLEILEPWLVPV